MKFISALLLIPNQFRKELSYEELLIRSIYWFDINQPLCLIKIYYSKMPNVFFIRSDGFQSYDSRHACLWHACSAIRKGRHIVVGQTQSCASQKWGSVDMDHQKKNVCAWRYNVFMLSYHGTKYRICVKWNSPSLEKIICTVSFFVKTCLYYAPFGLESQAHRWEGITTWAHHLLLVEGCNCTHWVMKLKEVLWFYKSIGVSTAAHARRRQLWWNIGLGLKWQDAVGQLSTGDLKWHLT